MAIAPELRAQILRLYQAERWRIGTIASQLHLHRDTVQRVIAQACVMRPDAPLRPSQIDAYLPFIRETLAKFPTLAASRLHAMVRERGYTGGPDHFRHLVACHRPRPAVCTSAHRTLRSGHPAVSRRAWSTRSVLVDPVRSTMSRRGNGPAGMHRAVLSAPRSRPGRSRLE